MKFQILAGATLLALGILFLNPVHSQTMGAAVPAGQGLSDVQILSTNLFLETCGETVPAFGNPCARLNTRPSQSALRERLPSTASAIYGFRFVPLILN